MGRDHWVETTLGEIATHPQYGWTSKAGQTGKYKYFRTTDIKLPINWGNIPFCVETPHNPDDYAIRKNDILVSRAGSVGLSIRFEEDHLDTLFASYLIRFRSISPIDSKLIEYYMATKEYWAFISESQAGIAVPNVNASKLAVMSFPLPPLNEQKRIVKKLDAILPKVKSAKARLEKISAILKKFRQSVLSAACSGRLTEDWREAKEFQLVTIDFQPIIGHNLDFPDTWVVCAAKEACQQIESGSTPKGKPFTATGEIPYLKVYNIVGQKINFDYKPQFIPQAVHEKELKRCKCYPNDVLMNIVGPPLGKIALVTDQFPEWNINQAIVVYRPHNFLNYMFLYYWLCSLEPIKETLKDTRGSAGQINISLTQARNIVIPIPPLEEQQEIVRRVEKLFALADSLEAKYKKAVERVEKIEQSVLAKAFRGELAEPDPNDEPAEELLKRILDEKAKLDGGRKTKSRRVSKRGIVVV